MNNNDSSSFIGNATSLLHITYIINNGGNMKKCSIASYWPWHSDEFWSRMTAYLLRTGNWWQNMTFPKDATAALKILHPQPVCRRAMMFKYVKPYDVTVMVGAGILNNAKDMRLLEAVATESVITHYSHSSKYIQLDIKMIKKEISSHKSFIPDHEYHTIWTC